MNFVQLALCFSLFHSIFGDETRSKSLWDEEIQKPIYHIQRINIFGYSLYMKVSAYKNANNSAFSLNVVLQQEMGSNFLIMNLKLRVRPSEGTTFITLLQLRNLDLCGFFTEYFSNNMMRYFLKSEMQFSDVITCPVRVGNYSLKNVAAKDIYPPNVQNGTYKFFVEVVEGTGEIAKVFALQVTTEIRVPSGST
ncbi:uncharacterized protein [Drosophila bipectinata]|uniref:uncharacterized protein n=1 Tax=Drosophila bipectinata TaxID=42026 RepID=UPI0038B2719B